MGRVKAAGEGSTRDLEGASLVLKALSHPLRLRILCVLGESGGEIAVQEIVAAIGSSQSNISQHLSIMRDKGVIVSRKKGNRVMYRIGDERMLALFNMVHELFCEN